MYGISRRWVLAVNWYRSRRAMVLAMMVLLAGFTALHSPQPSTSVNPLFAPPLHPCKLAVVLSSDTLRGA